MFFEPHGIGQRVHRQGVLRRSFGSEEVDFGAETEDEVVVRQGLQLGELHLARIEVDARHGRLVDDRVLLAVDQVAQRMANGSRFEQAGCELVQERLERVVVVLVDEHDLGIRVLQLARGADAGEAAAEDQDAWT